MPVKKNLFDNTIKEFYQKIFNSKLGTYKSRYRESEEFKDLRNDDNQRTKLYDYMREQIRQHDDIAARLQPDTMDILWRTGTDEEILSALPVDTYIDLNTIFDIQSYLRNSDRTRENRRRLIQENAEQLQAEEPEEEGDDEESGDEKPKQESKKTRIKSKSKTNKSSSKKTKTKTAGNKQATENKKKVKVVRNKNDKKEPENIIIDLSPDKKDAKENKNDDEEFSDITDDDKEIPQEFFQKDMVTLVERDKKEPEKKEKEKKEKEETVKPYKNLTNDRSIEVANELSGLTGIERKSNEPAPEYIDAVTSTANSLTEGVSASMTVAEQKSQLESNYQRILGEAEQKSGDLSMPILIYDLMNTYGVADIIRDITGMILPSLALTASGYRQTVKKKLGEGLSNPIYVSQNLMQRGYNNLAKFFGYDPDDDKKPSEPERKEEPDSYDSQGIRITEEDDAIDFREEPSIPRFTQEESLKAKEDLKNIGAAAAVLGVGVQAIRGDEPIITTKPVTSIIDNRPLTITRERVSSGNIGKRSEGGRRKYSPQIIYPDDEILEPTDNQLSRNEYNLAKFDFINPDNVGGNNSNGDNPLYKANDDELAIRYYDWKNMVIEQENEFVKQLPPKVSDKIKMQFRRSFVEPAEPRQTRLNYMIHDDTQFAPFDSPYSEMSVNTGTNPFIQTSVLYGSVP